MKTIEPIGIETQIETVLFGESKQEQKATIDKISLVENNIDNIISINGMKVKNASVKGEYIYYNNDYYYYPVKYAKITYKTLEL